MSKLMEKIIKNLFKVAIVSGFLGIALIVIGIIFNIMPQVQGVMTFSFVVCFLSLAFRRFIQNNKKLVGDIFG